MRNKYGPPSMISANFQNITRLSSISNLHLNHPLFGKKVLFCILVSFSVSVIIFIVKILFGRTILFHCCDKVYFQLKQIFSIMINLSKCTRIINIHLKAYMHKSILQLAMLHLSDAIMLSLKHFLWECVSFWKNMRSNIFA